MRAAAKDIGAGDLHTLQEELKKLGISVVSGRQDTVISIKIKGLAGRALIRGLRLADQLLQEKIKNAVKACIDPATKLFTDPTFGPCSRDPDGASAICKAGGVIPSKGGSQHQAKVLGLLQRGKIRWERPIYANEEDGSSPQEDDGDDIYAMSSSDNVFASNATLFADGVSSGDVIQGNLGDCWFLSALSVVATRSDLLEQTFWRRDQHKTKGLFVCKFMKNFVWNYVLIDDQLPVFGFTDKKAGKPYFARCRNPNELWVSLLEKAYAKLHGSYEALIGGFVDCALNDLTGMCSEQVILKDGFPGFGENPYTPEKPEQKHGDPFWEKITRYKQSGTLMGCSIQPPVTSKDVAVESSAGNGLYFKHAYALVDAAEIKTAKGEYVRLVKLRNPWGMGEWTGPWSDSSDERAANEDAIATFFKILKRRVGANAEKRMFMTLNAHGMVGADEISQEEVIEINANDGTFFMSYDSWMQSFTHFFAGIDFPDAWHGRRSEGCWNEANCGGNTTKNTWLNNPHFELVLEQRARVFVSLSQEDPRGSENLKIVPVGFHICSLSPVGNDSSKFEIREPAKKLEAYYRLYKPADRESFQTGKRPENLPPAIIPGTVISGIDNDGVAQAAYTFKQAVSVECTMEPGRYCIIPSMYMRTDKVSGNTNVGNFWVSVYSDKPTFRLEGGEKIVEEEEGNEEGQSNGEQSRQNSGIIAAQVDRRSSVSSSSRKSDTIAATGNAVMAEKRRKFENVKEELLRQAKRYGIGLRELRTEFGKTPKLPKAECRHKLQRLGFNLASWDDNTIGLVFGGLDEGQTNSIKSDRILKVFTPDIQEEKMACELPDMEEDGDGSDSIHREGVLEIELHGANGLAMSEKRQYLAQQKVQIPAPEFSATHCALRRRIASEILERDPQLAWSLRQFARKSELLSKSRYPSLVKQNRDGSFRPLPMNTSPVSTFYELLEKEYCNRVLFHKSEVDEPEYGSPISRATVYAKNDGISSFYAAPSPKTAPGWTLPPVPTSALELHKSNRIRDLEAKRAAKLALLLQHKQQALGDAEQTASLPRLIGGRKSGSSCIKCIDCGVQVLINGRSVAGDNDNNYRCNGANCVNVFCPSCYALLPLKSKLCEECYQHEISPEETFGEQLRVGLIEKIGASDQQKAKLEEIFRSFDADGSGSLSPPEFEKMLLLLNIQPALTQGQKAFLVDQFDANGDGEISLTEFKHWILRDHVWVESSAPSTSRETKLQSATEVLDSIIAPLCYKIIDSAYNAHAFSSTIGSWSRSTSTTAESQTKCLPDGETGVIIFERVLNLRIASTMDTNGAEKIFEQVDGDKSGNIDQFEFVDLLSVLGIHLNTEDAVLLMNRLGALSTGYGRITIEKSAFMRYVEQISTQIRIGVGKCASLATIVTKLNGVSSPVARGILQCELQTLHGHMTQKDLIKICKILEEKAEIVLGVDELKSLAINLSFDYQISAAAPEGDHCSLKSSGDFLSKLLLAESGNLMELVKAFDIESVCGTMTAHLRTCSGTNSTKSIWKSVLGLDIMDTVHSSDFISAILKTGFRYPTKKGPDRLSFESNDHLVTQLLISLVLDEVRMECQELPASANPVINFNLFRLIMRFQKIKEIELKLGQALTNYLQLCQGEQFYLVTIAIDASQNLVVRARDPVFKFSADFVLREDEYDYRNLLAQIGSGDFERQRQETHEISRELTFAKSPRGLITEEFYPELNNSMATIIERIRACFRHRNTAASVHSSRPFVLSLSMVESDAFASTLRNLLSHVELPFFWSVSQRKLVFSIDSEFLDQQNKSSFQQLVADTLSLQGPKLPPALRGLATFVANTASSLLVRYEVVGKHTNVETSWQEFQNFIAGQQNSYAVIGLHPQGTLFTTRIGRASGSGAVQWNFKAHIKMEEPERCDQRIDRPVVFTDTVKVTSIPGSAPSTENIRFTIGDERPGHFVVVSVRRALSSGPESPKPRLYCTVYDPLTSCDYSVEGYPSDWSVDFFDVTVNPSFESKWQEMLGKMRLGATITPKLTITVFNKQLKTDKLLGECEVSVGSAIVREGHIFEERVVLHQSTASVAGVAAVTFRFDEKKAPTIDVIKDKRRSSHDTGTVVPIKLGAKYLAGEIVTPRTEPVQDNSVDRLKQLEASITSIELSKLEAQEQVKQLKAQVQQLSYAGTRTSEDAAERWRRKLEQTRQEQFATEEQYAARLAALQEEIRYLSTEKEKQKNAPREASSLKDCRLSADASAHDILSAMRGILTARCPERPYNGLKKALAAEAEIPGKVTFAVLNDVLRDFGLALSSDHRSSLSYLFDPEMIGRVSIEDFFIKLCGDAEAYERVRTPRPPSPTPEPPVVIEEDPPEPVIFTPTPPPVQRPVSPISSPLRASGVRSKLSWQDMKKFLVLNLPEGWETRFTEKGRPYFCNHADRSTQWKHPRPEIETIFSEWVQENGAFFNRRPGSARATRQKH
ncbi:hypothetical protein V7S43_000337 [Phytophthora oleae]|uniref:Calmodulin n=1 Tax=Phytophthora oleae TaxID=2107226 RepID=A0ABD3G8X8_9STRA